MVAISRAQDPLAPAVLRRIGFFDADKAARLLAMPAMAPLASSEQALDDFKFAADPDLALLSISALLDGDDPQTDLVHAMVADAEVRVRLVRLLGLSVAFGEILRRHPDWWRLAAEPDPDRRPATVRAALLRAVAADPDAPVPVAAEGGTPAYVALRAEYRRQLIQIADKDLADELDVGVATEQLSDLADAVLETALAIARAEVPGHESCRLSIVAMGKCGARELNYLSDVDVIFVAEPTGDADEATAIEVGCELAKRLMNVTVAHTEEGSIWEVDAGLRPEGKAGALVRTLASHLDYYERWAKTWEFQALLKARPAAGDLALGEEFVSETRPLVWEASRRPDFVPDVQAMRRRVEASIPRRHADRELKLGTGGLRDIEFSVQMLQMVHGASDITVRARDTLTALEQLATWGYVGRDDARALAVAYRFLRTLEHRLQLRSLRRTHTLPADADNLRWLGRSMGMRTNPDTEVLAKWRSQARDVRRLHEKLFYRPLLNAVARLDPGQARLTPQAAEDRLMMLGYADPEGALRHLESLSSGVSRRAAIQRTLLPVMLGWFADAPDPDAGLLGFRQVSDALGGTPWYLRLLRDESVVGQRLANLLSSSRYTSELLLRAPDGVGMLADGDHLQPVPKEHLVAEMGSVARRQENLTDAIAGIRAIRRRELFRISAANVLRLLDIEHVGAALSDVADATVEETLAAARADYERRHPGPFPSRLLIVAMGRLGGRDLSYASDVDVLFVHDPLPRVDESAATVAAIEVFNLVRSELAVPSPDPPLGLDADLRPEGRQGPLVRTLGSYRAYYQRFSSPWEAQALLRARPLAGEADLAEEFMAVVDEQRYPSDGPSEAALREMRRLKARMESERLPRGADPRLNTKLGPGGVSDVEWIVQALQWRLAGAKPELRTTSTLAALESLRADGSVADADAAALLAAWRMASSVRNAITLVAGKPGDQIPSDVKALAGMAHILGYPPEDRGELVEDYLRLTRRARGVFDRLFYGEEPDDLG